MNYPYRDYTEFLAYLTTKEAIGVISKIEIRTDRDQELVGMTNAQLMLRADYPLKVTLYGVTPVMWEKVLKPEILNHVHLMDVKVDDGADIKVSGGTVVNRVAYVRFSPLIKKDD